MLVFIDHLLYPFRDPWDFSHDPTRQQLIS
jgi:hypothetical protein